jgi:hypothetical protein
MAPQVVVVCSTEWWRVRSPKGGRPLSWKETLGDLRDLSERKRRKSEK